VSAIESLVTELARLPGIGRKTAQRLVYHLLQQPAGQPERLAEALLQVAERVRPCGRCGNLTEADPCPICADPARDGTVLCVVEDAASLNVVERSTGYRGRYLVLGGRLSPLEGVGPDALRLGLLEARLAEGQVRELILATTATFVQQLTVGRNVRVTRLARGLPVGGDLEYVDGVTLAHALTARQEVP
jgi:recombination protein RecR